MSQYSSGDRSLEENKQFWPTFYTAFPDIKFSIKHLIAEGDKAAFQEHWTGTHKADFMGAAPTGRRVELTNTCIIRIASGKFIESWCTINKLRLMQQLGVIPE